MKMLASLPRRPRSAPRLRPRHPGGHYDNRGSLALCLAVMQGMPCEDACKMAGTKATRTRGDTGGFAIGDLVIWHDKRNSRRRKGIVEKFSDRIQIRILDAGAERKVWVYPGALSHRQA
jgi:hypothetical protein